MVCTRCLEDKPLDEFSLRKNGVPRRDCKACVVLRAQNNYYRNHEARKAYSREYYRTHAEKRRATHTPEQRKIYNRTYYLANKQRIIAYRNEQFKARRKVDPAFKLKCYYRNRIWFILRQKKSHKSKEYLGCSWDELKTHLEKRFQPGMSWDNYGQWHVDHIRPCASFDLNDPAQRAICFHFTNLQPLWASDNIAKGARIQ